MSELWWLKILIYYFTVSLGQKSERSMTGFPSQRPKVDIKESVRIVFSPGSSPSKLIPIFGSILSLEVVGLNPCFLVNCLARDHSQLLEAIISFLPHNPLCRPLHTHMFQISSFRKCLVPLKVSPDQVRPTQDILPFG